MPHQENSNLFIGGLVAQPIWYIKQALHYLQIIINRILVIKLRIIIFMLSSRTIVKCIILRVSNFINQFSMYFYKEIYCLNILWTNF